MAEPAPHERRPRMPTTTDGKPAGEGERKGFRLPGGNGFWVLVLALLAANYLSVALFAPGKETSVTIPYSPTFLDQVENGNVARINAQGEAVTGEFEKEVKY